MSDAAREMVTELVAMVRSADEDARWCFDVSDAGAPGVDLWLAVTREVRMTVTEAIEVEAEDSGWRFDLELGRSPAGAWFDERTYHQVLELTEASSELALSLTNRVALAGSLPAAIAFRHLSYLVDMVDPDQQRAFLFHCWEQASRELTPAQRVELTATATRTRTAGRLVRSLTDGTAPAATSLDWQQYLAVLHDITSEPVAPYVLLDHAWRTHRRLGVDAATEAFATWAVRDQLVKGTLTAPRLAMTGGMPNTALAAS